MHVPVFVEAMGDAEKQIAHNLAISLGVERCEEISFSQREKLHLAAVFANNFTIAMAGIARATAAHGTPAPAPAPAQEPRPDAVRPHTAETHSEAESRELFRGCDGDGDADGDGNCLPAETLAGSVKGYVDPVEASCTFGQQIVSKKYGTKVLWSKTITGKECKSHGGPSPMRNRN